MSINDPRDIPDLLAWYSPEAETGYTNGQTLSPMTDQSGLGNDAAQVGSPGGGVSWESTSGPTGCPAYRFNGPNSCTAIGITLGLDECEYMAYFKSDQGPATSQGTPIWTAGQGTGVHYTYSDDHYYTDWFSTVRRDFLFSDRGNWHRVGQWSANNDWATQVDGVTVLSSGSNSVGGGGNVNFGLNNLGQYWAGKIGAIVIYARKLTTQERADLGEWMDANPCGGFPYIPGPPGIPENLDITMGSTTGEFTWEQNATDPDDPTGYNVRVNGGTITDVGLTLSHLFTGLAPNGTEYTFEVQAYNAYGESDWAAIVGTTTVLVTPAWRVVLNGVELAGGDSPTTDVAGCLTEPPDGMGVPSIRTEDVTYLQRDGVRHFADWYDPRIITLNNVSVCNPGCDTCRSTREDVARISGAWSRYCADTELVIFTDCHDDSPAVTGTDRAVIGPYGVKGRPRVATTQWMGMGIKCATMLLRFDGVDERLFILDADGTPGSGEQCVFLEPDINQTCRTYPRCYPLCYDNTVTGSDGSGPQDLDNFGTLCASPTIVLTGPLTTPRIENVTTGDFLTYTGIVNAGETVTIDTEFGTAVDQDGNPRTNLLVGTTSLLLDVGVNTLHLTSQSAGDNGVAEVCFRPSVLSG